MPSPKRKLVVPPQQAAGDSSLRWIKSCLEYLRTECQLAANTIAAYTRDLKRFHEWLSGRNPTRLAIRDLSAYVGWLATQHLAPPSISRHLVAVKVFYRYLQLEGIIRDNVAELLAPQKQWERVPEVM